MTPALQAIRQAIEDQITTNHNGEIAGAILNPILAGMVTALVDSIGDIEQLDTVDKENTVRAINELNALIQDLEPIQKFTGEDNPNDNPPAGAKLGDLYFQMDGGVVIDVWQFIEIRWVSLDTSSFVRKSGENLVSTDFTLKNKVGSAESSINLEGIEFKVTSKDVDENWNATLSFSAEEGFSLTFADGGRYVIIYDYEIQGNNFRLAFPDTQGNQRRIPVSVNNQFADEFGNIEIEVDENAVTYDLQEPTPEQQANARENIGVTTSLYKQSFLDYDKNTNPDAEFTLDFVPLQVVSLVINRDKILHAELDDYEIVGNLLTISEPLEERDNVFITYYH